MKRALASIAVVLLCAAPAAAAKRSWAQAEIRLVVSQGLMADSVASFRPEAPLTRGALEDLAAGLNEREPAGVALPNGAAPVTMAELDARLVAALDLSDEASLFYRGARAAGLKPPGRFGREVVARLIGLRYNHPAAHDDLELLPTDVATRAEAAYSAAQILRFRGRETEAVEELAEEFALPALTPWQRRVLSTAFRFVGYPYVWGGTSDVPQALFGVAAPGGFDCSGFLWRVFRVERYAGGAALGSTLRGRTAAQMAGEVGRARRIGFARLEPGDALFFGARGPRSKPAEVNHAGIYAGNGWMVHSSRYGTTLVRLDGWYRERFAWARRPLAEAGLAGA